MSGTEPISRRALLRGRFLAGLVDTVSRLVEVPEPSGPRREEGGSRFHGAFPVHRPPGAVDEPTFLRDCTRCDACLEACPPDAIVHAPRRFRQAAGTPMIDAAREPCRMCEDPPCIAACEPGVLSAHLPLKMGTALITPQTCLAWQGTLCTVCSEQCPVEGAIELEAGKPRIVDDRCTGCGVCHHVCPAPTNAVVILPLRDRPTRPAPQETAMTIQPPPLHDAALTADDARQLLADIEAHTELLQVSVKGGPESFVRDGAVTLADARAVIESRAARGVQIRYRFEDAEWWDTLMLSPAGIRLIRVRHGERDEPADPGGPRAADEGCPPGLR